MWAYNFLRTKYFHEVSPASLHAYSLKSRYGIVSVYDNQDAAWSKADTSKSIEE
jgi:hypothetical protein